jgi:hypothetical protein
MTLGNLAAVKHAQGKLNLCIAMQWKYGSEAWASDIQVSPPHAIIYRSLCDRRAAGKRQMGSRRGLLESWNRPWARSTRTRPLAAPR